MELTVVKLGHWIGIIGLIIALVVLWNVRELLLLVLTSVVLATALNALVQQLQKTGMRRSRAVFLTLSLTLLSSILFVGLVVPPFVSQFLELLKLFPTAFAQALTQLELIIEQQPDWFPDFQLPDTTDLATQFQPLAQNLLQELFSFFSNSLTNLLKLLLVIVLTIMLLSDPQAYRQSFIYLFPSFYRRRADEILVKCEIGLGNWLGGLIISSSLVAALCGVGLWMLQIQFVLAHALVAGLLNFIPNIGPTISVVFPLVIALLDSPWKAVGVLLIYIFVQQIESYWVTPTVMASQVSLLPGITLVAQIFFASFFGFLGLLLALPLAVIAKTWIEEALIHDILNKWDAHAVHAGEERSPERVPIQTQAADCASDGAAKDPTPFKTDEQ